MHKLALAVALVVALGCAGKAEKPAKMTIAEVPTDFVATAKKQLPEVTFDHAYHLPNGNWEIRGKNKEGKTREVEVNAKGEVVEIE